MAKGRAQSWIIWAILAAIILVPIALAATSTLLAYRDLIYISAGFAGIVAMALLLLQPVLAGELLPGLRTSTARKWHRWVGVLLALCIAGHVAGLWITSPPDVIDALTFTSPTPFSAWGVIAMWAVFGTAAVTLARKQIGLRAWRRLHKGLALIIVSGTVAHAVLIEGTMEPISKTLLSATIVITTLWIMSKNLRNPVRNR